MFLEYIAQIPKENTEMKSLKKVCDSNSIEWLELVNKRDKTTRKHNRAQHHISFKLNFVGCP